MSHWDEITREAEQAAIGAACLDAISVLAAAGRVGIDAEQFCYKQHRILWDTIESMSREGAQIDTFTIKDTLTKRGQLENAGGVAILTKCMDAAQSTAHAESYFRQIREQWQRRQIAETGLELQRESKDAENPGEAIAHGLDRLQKVGEVKTADPSEAEILDSNLSEWVEVKRKRQNGEPVEIGIPTGWAELDQRLNGGLPRGAYVVIAGRPSAGKTLTEENLAVGMAMRGKHVVRVTVDMTRKRLYKRTICRMTGATWYDLTNGYATDDQMEQAKSVSAMLKGLNMTTIERERDCDRIIARLRAIHAKNPIDVFSVDYLQALRCDSRNTDKAQERVKYISATFKTFAQEINATNLMLAQLNRGSETENHLPRMSNIRDAGEIEQDAEIGILLSKNEKVQVDPAEWQRVKRIAVNFDIAKQQDGETGVLPFWRDGSAFTMRPAPPNWGAQ